MGNKGGRPPMEKGKRSFKIDVRFTEAEYRKVEELEKALGISKAELVRKRLLGNAEDLLLHNGAVLTALDKLSLELARTGNNINQLARYANRLQKHGVLSPRIMADFTGLMDEHRRQRTEMELLFRKLLRTTKRS